MLTETSSPGSAAAPHCCSLWFHTKPWLYLLPPMKMTIWLVGPTCQLSLTLSPGLWHLPFLVTVLAWQNNRKMLILFLCCFMMCFVCFLGCFVLGVFLSEKVPLCLANQLFQESGNKKSPDLDPKYSWVLLNCSLCACGTRALGKNCRSHLQPRGKVSTTWMVCPH